MAQQNSKRPGFLDHLSSPWVLLPAATGLTLLLAAWVFTNQSKLLSFLGAAAVVVGVSVLATQWLFASPTLSAEQARMRQELMESLALADRAAGLISCTEGEMTGTPAAIGP